MGQFKVLGPLIIVDSISGHIAMSLEPMLLKLRQSIDNILSNLNNLGRRKKLMSTHSWLQQIPHSNANRVGEDRRFDTVRLSVTERRLLYSLDVCAFELVRRGIEVQIWTAREIIVVTHQR